MTVDVQWVKTVRCMQRCLCVVSGARGPTIATFGQFPGILGESKLSEPFFEEGDVFQEPETTVTVVHSENRKKKEGTEVQQNQKRLNQQRFKHS